MKTDALVAALLLCLCMPPMSGMAGDIEIHHTGSPTAANPDMEKTVEWLNDHLGKVEFPVFQGHGDAAREIDYGEEYHFRYLAQPPRLTVTVNETRHTERELDVHKSSTWLVDLGLVDRVVDACTPHYPMVSLRYKAGEGHDEDVRADDGRPFWVTVAGNSRSEQAVNMCRSIVRALSHLAEHAPYRQREKELF